MFTRDQKVYYVNNEFEVKLGIFKGYIKICTYSQIIHLIDIEYEESVLINEDLVYDNEKEAKKDLFIYECEND